MAEVRARRLQSDFERLKSLVAGSGGRLRIKEQSGSPPDEYVIVYHCRSIEEVNGGRPVYREHHDVRFQLSQAYPGAPPLITVLTPIFHPHVWSGDNTFCLLDHGRRVEFYLVGEYLDKLVLRIGAMLQYDPQFIAPGSAANRVAMDWFTQNRHRLPLDTQTFSSAIVWREAPLSWTDL
jgi:ubiquitin-protein ligase